jgi:hypothetical protein
LSDKNYVLLFIAKENTWSNQRRKKRSELHQKQSTVELKDKKRELELDDELDTIRETKKLKTDDYDTYLIKCEIEVKLLDKIIYLKLDYKDGESKDYLHQILQFITNKIQKIS